MIAFHVCMWIPNCFKWTPRIFAVLTSIVIAVFTQSTSGCFCLTCLRASCTQIYLFPHALQVDEAFQLAPFAFFHLLIMSLFIDKWQRIALNDLFQNSIIFYITICQSYKCNFLINDVFDNSWLMIYLKYIDINLTF